MTVQRCSFGTITVDGTTYTGDVVIYPGRVHSPWWRRQGHVLCIEDLEEVFLSGPEVVVVGTGHYGVMQVPDKTIEAVEARGIELHARKTPEAVTLFNALARRRKTVACLHLSC
jgi:hypothetical protein